MRASRRSACKRVRVVTPWNVALSRGDRAWLDDWLASAAAAGVDPLVSFGAAHRLALPGAALQAAHDGGFERAFRAFRARWPAVRTIGVWNEANHRSQPTFRYPEQAAAYFNVVRKRCRGCRVVAADVIDDRNMVRWLGRFRAVARGARLWGLHNYRDGNPRRGQRYGGTKLLLRTVPGKIWLTETGGIVKFVLPDGRSLFPYSERRANAALGRVLRLARAVPQPDRAAVRLPLAPGLLRQPLRRRPPLGGRRAARELPHARALARDSLVQTVTSGWRVARCSVSVSRTQRRSSALAIR